MMRMTHYFAVMAGLLVPALIATVITGALAWPSHVTIGLFSAILAIGVHTLVILFMVVTGRVLREAIRVHDLPRDFLVELNEFFASKAAYPLAVFSALLVVAAAVLGYAHLGFGVHPSVHWLVGIGAIAFNLYALGAELRVLAGNQRLIDRAAAELDRIEREQAARGLDPSSLEEPLDPAARVRRLGWTLALGAWLPYLYWALIVWRGDFAKVPILPWALLSALGLALLLLARRRPAPPEPATTDRPR